MAARIRLGELLVEAGIISRDQLESALERQRQDGRRLGVLLVDEGLVTETQVTQILSQQLSVPWVSLYHIEFSRELLQLVSRELAEKHQLVPIFVRRVRGLGNALYVAMDDPTDPAPREEVETYCGLPVRTMIASPTDIASAIRVYYGGESDSPSLAEALWEAGDADAEEAAGEGEREPEDAAADTTVAESAPAPGDDAPELEYREVELDERRREIAERAASLEQPKASAPRVITLTLLDGTQVTLPAPAGAVRGAAPADGTGRWTARDFIRALRGVERGEDMAKSLGEEVRWESAFAALLAVLLKKQLIADWEFVEQYRKHRDRKQKKQSDSTPDE